MNKVEIVNTLAFIGTMWMLTYMLLVLLWAVKKIWRVYIKPMFDLAPHIVASGRGEPTEEIEGGM